MVSQSDYFAANRYKPVYEFGARVSGRWNNIPFIGSVGNDTVVNEEAGPRLSIHLDLPIRYENETKHVIIVNHKDVKRLKEY